MKYYLRTEAGDVDDDNYTQTDTARQADDYANNKNNTPQVDDNYFTSRPLNKENKDQLT